MRHATLVTMLHGINNLQKYASDDFIVADNVSMAARNGCKQIALRCVFQNDERVGSLSYCFLETQNVRMIGYLTVEDGFV